MLLTMDYVRIVHTLMLLARLELYHATALRKVLKTGRFVDELWHRNSRPASAARHESKTGRPPGSKPTPTRLIPCWYRRTSNDAKMNKPKMLNEILCLTNKNMNKRYLAVLFGVLVFSRVGYATAQATLVYSNSFDTTETLNDWTMVTSKFGSTKNRWPIGRATSARMMKKDLTLSMASTNPARTVSKSTVPVSGKRSRSKLQ